jgi:carbon starvation protein
MPAISRFVDGSGLVVAGKMFPFCFITIACGAISGFHTLISSGITPKIITRESFARPIGYGAMCLESLVAIMALVAACSLDTGVYLSMNVKGEPAAVVKKVSELGFAVSVPQMEDLAHTIGEQSLFGRTGGAATLAVGMAQIFSKLTHGRWLDLWYHFAIMFEALFILTTLDAGTRVGRYLLQDVLGNLWAPLGETKSVPANLVASVLVVAGWGYFLIQGVRDPLGGINSLWPLFGIANQLLAAIALCLATTVILKMQLAPRRDAAGPPDERLAPKHALRPAFAIVTLVPLLWLLTVTVTAGVQKIFHPEPRIGFLAQAAGLEKGLPALQEKLRLAEVAGDSTTTAKTAQELRVNRAQRFNNLLDAVVAGAFLILVAGIFCLSVVEWVLLLRGRRPAELHESPAVWLPDYALREGTAAGAIGAVAVVVGLARELSDEAALERARQAAAAPALCQCEQLPSVRLLAEPESAPSIEQAQDECSAVSPTPPDAGKMYEDIVKRRLGGGGGVTRCC